MQMLAGDKSFPGDLHTERTVKTESGPFPGGALPVGGPSRPRSGQSLFQLHFRGGGPELCRWGRGVGAPSLWLCQCFEPLQTPWLRSLLEKRQHVSRLQQEFSWCRRTVPQRSGTLEVAGCVQVTGFTCWPPKSSVSERGLLGYGTFLLCEEGAVLLPWPHSQRLVPI